MLAFEIINCYEKQVPIFSNDTLLIALSDPEWFYFCHAAASLTFLLRSKSPPIK